MTSLKNMNNFSALICGELYRAPIYMKAPLCKTGYLTIRAIVMYSGYKAEHWRYLAWTTAKLSMYLLLIY